MAEFWVTVSASHEKPELMPRELCYLFPASSFWNRGRAKVRRFPRSPKFPFGVRRAADCGGFVASFQWGGRYPYTPVQYVNWLGVWTPEWAATMDYCCENPITGGSLSKLRHRQKKTTKLAWLFWNKYRNVPWMWVPTVQGWNPDDYETHAKELKPLVNEMRSRYGDKFKVGIGTLCARASNQEIREIVGVVSTVLPGVNFHLWGVKSGAASLIRQLDNVSFDSAAWDGLTGVRDRVIWDQYKGEITQREYSYTIALPKYLLSLENKGVKIDKSPVLFPELPLATHKQVTRLLCTLIASLDPRFDAASIQRMGYAILKGMTPFCPVFFDPQPLSISLDLISDSGKADIIRDCCDYLAIPLAQRLSCVNPNRYTVRAKVLLNHIQQWA